MRTKAETPVRAARTLKERLNRSKEDFLAVELKSRCVAFLAV